MGTNRPHRHTESTELCGAKRTRRGDGAPCRHPAGWGTDHVGIGRCKLHGGSTPTHVAAAERERATRNLATLGLPRAVDPAQALLEEVYRCAGHVAWLSAQVAELDPLSVATSQLVELYGAERDRLVRVAKATVEAGVAQATVRLAERQGELVERVIRGVLGDFGLLADPRVGDVVQRHLRAVVDAPALGA